MSGIVTAVMVAALGALAAAWLAAVMCEHGMHPLMKMLDALRRPAIERAILAAVVVGFIHHGATKGTNGVNQLPPAPPPMMNMEGPQPGSGMGPFGGGAIICQTGGFLPASAQTNVDWLAFGAHDDWFRIEDCGWCFRFGTNLVEGVTVLARGEIRAGLCDASNRISLLGMPLAVVPAANWHMLPDGRESLFWHEVTASNTLLMTWRNALLLRDTNLPVTVRAELFPSGAAELRYDVPGSVGAALTNAAAQIWRNGEVETVEIVDLAEPVEFPAPEIGGTNSLDEVYARIAGGNSNAYYFADVVVANGPARVTVDALGESSLGDYVIMAAPGETNRLTLLVGERYSIASETAFSCFALVPSELQSEESFPVATNLTDRLVEVAWPVTFALEEVSASGIETVYGLVVTPAGLGGIATWDVAASDPPMRGAPPPMRSGGGCSCGCISVPDGTTNMIAHASSCECTDCSASGDYGYEGRVEHFEIEFRGDTGGDDEPGNGEDPGDPPEPTPPSVSVSFDKKVVIFEDGYTNSPGMFVQRQSNKTKLTVTAYGGENGATLSLAVAGGLEKCPGQSEVPGMILPGQTVSWEANYEGVSASGDIDGATATASIMDFTTLQTSDASDSLTVMEVKVKALHTAPQNPCWQRHDYGVCEQVVLQHLPTSANMTWSTAGNGTIQSGPYDILTCPPLGGTESLTASYQGESYCLDLNIIEPQAIVASNVTWMSDNVATGIAGHVGMAIDQYVAPFNVSFCNIAIEEVPSEEGFHSGYYANPSMSNLWSHTRSNGAGLWHVVNMMNRITTDRATCGSCPQPWSQGTLIWAIPFGWHPLTGNGGAPSVGTPPTKEFATDVTHTIVINSTGFVILMKLDHWVSRDIYNEIALDGVVVREGEQ